MTLELDAGELAALAALTRNRAPAGDHASGHDIRQQLSREGYSRRDAVLALRSLIARGLLERLRVDDAEGFFYTGYRLTRAGLALPGEYRSMQFPDFFALAPRIVVRDRLAELLGAAEEGVLEYGYADAVKLAGHSCPTVAAAYMLTLHALRALYPDALPERGGVRVEFAAPFDEGVTGVIASIVTLLTGAAQDGGFKGIAGHHARRNLQHFGCDVPLQIRFMRLDNGATVDAAADLSATSADPAMMPLLHACIAGRADPAQRRQFADLWQQRVRSIVVDHAEDKQMFRMVAAAQGN